MHGSTRKRLRQIASIAIPAAVALYLIGLIDETMDPSPHRFFVMLAAVIEGVALYRRGT